MVVGKYVIQALEIHGCKFPGSLCHTWTMTNGNALHSLIKFYISVRRVDKISTG